MHHFNTYDETFCAIAGFPNYQISNIGNIMNSKTNRVLKTIYTLTGYEVVNISSKGKQRQFSIHKLVARTFVRNPENKPLVIHADCDKRCNHFGNLHWVTYSENKKRIELNKRRIAQIIENE
jgi:hypothetical protein